MDTPATPPYEPMPKRAEDCFCLGTAPSMPSPPDLTHESDEEEKRRWRQTTLQDAMKQRGYLDRINTHRTKSIPQRSPSSPGNSLVFQLDWRAETVRVVSAPSVLAPLRERIARGRARRGRNLHKPTRVQIPRSKPNHRHDPIVSRKRATSDPPPSPYPSKPHTTPVPVPHAPQLHQHHHHHERSPRPNAHILSAGRPSRVKGPCQACQESSDGCMRKAFNWPFPTSSVFNDKGKPFVYLCNKCGLRYNKSGGCVCRNCRWVFCKEEKRKAMQYIHQMQRSRPDHRVDPDEDIQGFVCTPKYWSCGRPWKVGWVLNSEDEGDEDAATLNLTHASDEDP